MTSTTFVLSPISAEKADHLRDRGGPVYVADEHPGFPCRQCLQDAAIGDELVLVSHDPFESESEYRSASPIFLHRTRCGSPGSITELPTQLTARQLSVRAFDSAEMMIDAAVIDGDRLAATIGRFFDNADANRLHVHNATRGCWAVSVERPDG